MATRSTIALEYADGTIDQIYCHWDGYLSHNGTILQKNYQDPFKVQVMMQLGDLSSLGDDIGEQHDFAQAADYANCTFYGRDRGETDIKANRFKDFEDYKANHQYEEYEYILRRDGNWYVSQDDQDYELLAAALVEQESPEDA
jgi:hypothetical protein